jgi:hypothetical protein
LALPRLRRGYLRLPAGRCDYRTFLVVLAAKTARASSGNVISVEHAPGRFRKVLRLSISRILLAIADLLLLGDFPRNRDDHKHHEEQEVC